MGINFLYIGRDENTLKDKLRIETLYPEAPLQMNMTGVFGMRGRGRGNSSAFNASAVLATLGRPAGTDLSKFLPGFPPGFNLSEPFVEAPFPPFKPRAFNFPSMIPGIPRGFNASDPVSVKKMDGILKTTVPGLPKDFSLSNIYVSGGIVLSEMETLMTAIYKAGLMKNNFGPGALLGSVNRLINRSIHRLRQPHDDRLQ